MFNGKYKVKIIPPCTLYVSLVKLTQTKRTLKKLLKKKI